MSRPQCMQYTLHVVPPCCVGRIKVLAVPAESPATRSGFYQQPGLVSHHTADGSKGFVFMPVNPDTDGSDSDCLFESLETHYSQLAEATVLFDLRSHPRFDTGFPAEARSAIGRKTHATITDLSRYGLRLEGSRKMLDALFPDFSRQTGHTPTPLQIDFTVPDGSDRHLAVKVQCRSVYIRHEKKDTWQVGMAITEFDAGDEALTKYLFLREAAG